MSEPADATRMDPPPSRYRVVEKDGLLVVVDNVAAGPDSRLSAPSSTPGGGQDRRFGPADAARRLLEAATVFALMRAVRGWDEEGRAVVAWEWKKNGRTHHWNARLDEAQQRRLGQALLLLVSPVPLALAFFLFGYPVLGIFLALPLFLVGGFRLNRLQTETSDGDDD